MRQVLIAMVAATSVLLSSCGSGGDPEIRVAINNGDEGRAVRDLAESFTAAEVQVVELAYGDLREQLSRGLATNNSRFDVIMIDDPWFTELSPHFLPLGDVEAKYAGKFVSKSEALGRKPYGSGEILAAPFVGNTQLLFYRKDLLTEVGVSDPPRTWTELVALAERITRETDSYGYAIRGRAGAAVVTDFLPIFWSLGGRVVDDRGDPRNAVIEADKFKEALILYRRLARASPQGAVNFDWTEMTTEFINGNAAMQLNWPAAVPTVNDGIGGANPLGVWSVALAPGNAQQTPGSGQVTQSSPGTSMIGNWLLAVPETSDDPNLSEDFIEFILDQQKLTVSAGTPPTLTETFDDFAAPNNPDLFHIPLVRDALELSTVRPRTEKWSQIELAISDAVTGYLIDDDGQEEQIANSLRNTVNGILASE